MIKMKIPTTILATLLLSLAVKTFAGEEHMKPPPRSAEFNRLSQLVGQWEATNSHHPQGEKSAVEYSLSSAGTALVEKLFVGTPHEMVSVYHDVGGKLMMTHYCAMGNAPKLELQKASQKEYDFSLANNSGLNDAKEPHMHSLNVKFKSQDKLVQKWTSWKEGKETESTIIELKRVQ